MAHSAFRIHGAGHGVADLILPDLDFASAWMRPYRSLAPGDGGLELGKVVLFEDLLRFSGKPRESLLADLKGKNGSGITKWQVGGPGLVSLAVASQLLKHAKVPVTYYGLSGDDSPASSLRHQLAQTPLDLTCYRQRPGRTPVTWVGNDPSARSGDGERFFLHDPGTVVCDAGILGESFFQATFNVYAGTALLPALHAELPALLAKGRHRGAFNIVATVFDSVSERSAPGRPWSMGLGEAYPLVDLLVANAEEVRGLAGLHQVEECVAALFERGLTAAVITQGPGDIYYRSLGGLFGRTHGYAPSHPDLVAAVRSKAMPAPGAMPEHRAIIGFGDPGPRDTAGAGDNFLAGLLADLMWQSLADDFYPKGEVHIERELLHIAPLRLRQAIDFGKIAGGLACLQSGGLKIEGAKGERLAQIHAHMPQTAAISRPW